jgi:adenylylsulfate kinase
MKILVMGLPGSGKTTLATELAKQLNASYFNADDVRKMFNDWDFSEEGRIRQASRMAQLSQVSNQPHTIADFVCPTVETRMAFSPDFIIYMNTIEEGRFEDTNKIFTAPENADIIINEWADVEAQAAQIVSVINQLTSFDSKAPTGLMIGRYQPFHDGHKKLFEEILRREGQVHIMIRDTHGTDEKNPFDANQVAQGIFTALNEYRGKFIVTLAPNITGVYYGRDVGYKVEKINLDEATENISATQIRKEMGL